MWCLLCLLWMFAWVGFWGGVGEYLLVISVING